MRIGVKKLHVLGINNENNDEQMRTMKTTEKCMDELTILQTKSSKELVNDYLK